MAHSKASCALLCTVLLVLTVAASALDYTRVGAPLATIYSPEDHGGHNQLWSSLQSDDGLIYVAHSTGITQWDGEHWHNLPSPERTPVRALCQWSRDGRIYGGTTNGLFALALNDRRTTGYSSLLDDWSFDERQFGEVLSVACTAAGVVFVSQTAVYFWDGRAVNTIEGMPVGRYRLFLIDHLLYFKPLNETVVRILEFGESGPRQRATTLALPASARLQRLLRSTRGQLVAVTARAGIFAATADTFEQVVRPEQLDDLEVYNATQSRDGTYYLPMLYDGLFVLDESFAVKRHYREADGISMDTVFSVVEDRQGTLWLTGIPNVVRLPPPHVVSEFKAGLTSTEILTLEQTDAGLIAVGNALFRLAAATRPRRSPSFVQVTQSKDSYVDALVEGERLYYAGLNGVFALPLQNLSASPVQLVEAGLGRDIRRHPLTAALYAISSRGLFRLLPEDNTATLIPGTQDALNSIEIGPDGVIWLGTATQKLYRVVDPYPAPGAADVRRLGPDEGIPPGVVTPFAWRGALVLDTTDGLFKSAGNAASRLVRPDNLPATVGATRTGVTLFYQDPHAAAPRLWYQANEAAAVFDLQPDGTWRRHDHVFARFNGDRPSYLLSTSPEEVWHVQNKGVIRRLAVAAALTPPPAGLLNVRGVTDLRTGSSLSASGAQLALDQQTNAIRIRYALADSASGQDAQYRYRLLGGDNDRWSAWSTQTSTDYTTLGGGRYAFEVQSRDAWGRVASAGFRFPVSPPWYLSRPLLALYAVAGLVLLITSSWLTQRWRTRKLMRQNEALESLVTERTADVERQAQQLREQQMLKDRFFGNVSHEFRTPLTLTIGPLETLVTEHEKQLSAPVVQLATTALNNARRMLALVGQVLDLNRLEAGKLPLRVARQDLAALLMRIHERFTPWAQEHGQSLTCQGCEEPVERWVDEDQMDRCVSNLVSNAIKYSGQGSDIVMRLVHDGEQTGLQVSDNGVGIADELRSRVFERYMQGTASEQVTTPGTGIGLSLVKEVIELHGGQVVLDSEVGQGSQFTLWIPDGHEHFTQEQLIEPVYAPSPSNAADDADLALPANANDHHDRTTLLIVDDNRELRNFMSLRLSASYRILQAENGKLGFEMACRELPDLIVSDVMMPVMSGLDMVRQIKDTEATRTIPVILLTARATKRETVEGFAHGADDYLTKPFDVSELIVRVNAQITARKAIRETLMREVQARQAATAPATTRATFEDRFKAVVAAHLGETDLDVRRLASRLNMSTDTLTRRCKKAFGQTPLEALTRARLDQATVLLEAGQLSVSEVGYSVGFESLAYFSRRYKQFIGVPPSDVLRRSS